MLELTNLSKTFNPGTPNQKTALSHLNFRLEDGDFAGYLAYCVVMWRLLRHMFSHDQTMDGLVETARLYSSEIEYSDENVDALMDRIDRQIREGMD